MHCHRSFTIEFTAVGNFSIRRTVLRSSTFRSSIFRCISIWHFPSGVFPSGRLPTAFPSGGGTYQNASSNRTALDPAYSASYLSFRKQAACTSSLSSFLAQGITSSLNSYYDIISPDGFIYLAHSSYTVFYQTTTNDNTIFTTLGPDGPCCNTCDIDYPQADILYWPVQTTDTWCLQFGATSPPPVTIGSVEGSILPAVLPESTRLPVYGNLARKDRKIRRVSTTITSAPSQLARKGRAIARRTHLPEGESYAVGANVFTFISPSV